MFRVDGHSLQRTITDPALKKKKNYLKTSLNNNQTRRLLAWLSLHACVTTIVGCAITNSSVCCCCCYLVCELQQLNKAAHTWNALNGSSCSRSMFTLAPVTFTPCEVSIKDEATTLKCENTTTFLSLLCIYLFFPAVYCTTCVRNIVKWTSIEVDSSPKTLDRG